MPLNLKQSAETYGAGRWKWAVWLDGAANEVRKVQKVRYLLHPTFKRPIRIVENRRTKFKLQAVGWGEFTLRADVFMKDGAVQRLEHDLKLPEPTPRRRAAANAKRKMKLPGRKKADASMRAPDDWIAHWSPARAGKTVLEGVAQPRTHITFIHGIANKPSAAALLRDWLQALAEQGGVDFEREHATASMIYWADVLYAEPLAESVEAVESLVPLAWELDLDPQEEFFVASLRRSFRSAEAEAAVELGRDREAGAEERVPLPWFVKRPLTEALLRDVHHYLFNVEFSPRPGVSYRVRDEIRRRFVQGLAGATAERHIVVSHSMGTVIAYDCLKRVADCPRIDTLMTIGSPLGLDEIQDMLRPEWTRRNGFPADKTHDWANVFDRLDPVCGFDPELANDYELGGRKAIEDIHEPNEGLWRHDALKYLRGPKLRARLAQAMSAPMVAGGRPRLALTAQPESAPLAEGVISVASIDNPPTSVGGGISAAPIGVELPQAPAAPVTPPQSAPDDAEDRLRELVNALDQFDRPRVVKLCEDCVRHLRHRRDPFPEPIAAQMLGHLRRKRYFREICQVADALLEAGNDAPVVRRQYVQALIDEGNVAAGLAMAKALAADSRVDIKEIVEAKGLVGRAYKQWYVNSAGSDVAGASDALRHAIDAYFDVYGAARDENLWHGINVVALLARARRDGISIFESLSYPALAERLLERVKQKRQSGACDAWDMATAMEACVALNRMDEALAWARDYVRSPYADAFELASTLRQLVEVWQLDKQREPGSLLLPLLEAELLKRNGGELSFERGAMLSAQADQTDRAGQLEKVFGRDSYVTWTWYRLGLARCRAVARIETETQQAVGTGFLVRGGDFHPSFGNELLVLTNAHVVSPNGAKDSLRPQEAFVRFEAADESSPLRCRAVEALATSPEGKLDYTLLRIDGRVPPDVACPLILTQPDRASQRRYYIIGHPNGQNLSLSIHDNLLVDFEAPFLHYRTPTNPGSSGSPVFDDQWRLIALHHAGSRQMRRLHGMAGTYEANEGIWIKSIIDDLAIQRQATVEAPTARAEAPPVASGLQARSMANAGGNGKSSTKGTNMESHEKTARLRQFIASIAPQGVESVAPSFKLAAEATAERALPARLQVDPEAAQRGVEKLTRGETLSATEAASVEAIVLPRERPVTFIENDTFATPESPWEHFAQPEYRSRIEAAIPSVGRIELPGNLTIPFGGTAFVVGNDLLMTNRHVAELFASGLGVRNVAFRSGQTAGWDYRREKSSPPGNETMLEVQRVVMIHPYWDMAIVRVGGLNSRHPPLRLSVARPEDLLDREVAVIGFPAKDWRNDSDLQDLIFKRTYNVKRLQPGKIKPRASIDSFEHVVSAMTHDSSTLGGNSGSVLIDAVSGEAVGLHFAGRYLEANYAVPTYELARDERIVDLGVNFNGRAPANAVLTDLWRRLESQERGAAEPSTQLATQPALQGPLNVAAYGKTEAMLSFNLDSVRCTISLPISITTTRTGAEALRPFEAAPALLEGLRIPVIFPRLDDRKGYDPDFLGVSQGPVPLPELTSAGQKVAAKLDDGSYELKYHKFSLVMHKHRRLALFTAANVDWREQSRKVNGRKPSRKELDGTGGAGEKWITDERLPENQQLPDEFYTKDGGAFDKGHLVRRDDVCWGSSFKDIQKANGDTFHTTNCSPQVAGFNRSTEGEDNWGDLEDLVQKETDAERVIIFSGPVLDPDDLRFEGVDKRGDVQIQIPSKFWKIVLANDEDGSRAFGFILEQDLADVPLEFAVPQRWRRYLRSIAEIERLLFGLASLDWLKAYDQLETTSGRRMASRVRR